MFLVGLLWVLAAAGCAEQQHGETSVWVVDVSGADTDGAIFGPLQPGGDGIGETTVVFHVRVAACSPSQEEVSTILQRGEYRHRDCSTNPALVDGTEELTVEAEVALVAERRHSRPSSIRQLETIRVDRVGPLRFGERVALDPVSYRFELLDGVHHRGYRIHAKVRNCRLSNGSACGANSVVLGYGDPAEAVAQRGLSAENAPAADPTFRSVLSADGGDAVDAAYSCLRLEGGDAKLQIGIQPAEAIAALPRDAALFLSTVASRWPPPAETRPAGIDLQTDEGFLRGGRGDVTVTAVEEVADDTATLLLQLEVHGTVPTPDGEVTLAGTGVCTIPTGQ